MPGKSTVNKITILGDGGWGTALAVHLARLGRHATLWGAFPEYIRRLRSIRENEKFLPGVKLPQAILFADDLETALQSAEMIILAVPSQYMRVILKKLPKPLLRGKILVNVAKGIEQKTLMRMSQVIHDVIGSAAVVTLSGPSIAKEVALGKPASVVAASRTIALAEQVQRSLMSETLRIYTSSDVVGVELGGALKNPLAIAAGIADGLDLGTNAKAALLSRGVVEMVRLGAVLGGRKETFLGLSGMGDLVTTCLAGRNHWLGVQIGRGRPLKQVLKETPCVIEGVDTARSSVALAREHAIELPIIEQVRAVLFRGKDPQRALRALMCRTGKAEKI